MKQFLLRSSLLFAFCCCPFFSWGQTTQEIQENLKNDRRIQKFNMDAARGTPSMILMHPEKSSLTLSGVPDFLAGVLGSDEQTQFQIENSINSNGLEVHKIQQYYAGVKVEHGAFKVALKNGKVVGITSEYYLLPSNSSTAPGLGETSALQKAVNFIGATTYAWELVEALPDSPEKAAALAEVSPKGELVWVDNYATSAVDLSLAWKFDIYAAAPLSRDKVYVDANSGEILLVDAIIKHANGNHGEEEILENVKKKEGPAPAPVFVQGAGETRYAGIRKFDTSQDANGNYVLKGITPSGVENETFSYEGIGGLPLSIPALSSLAVPVADGDGDLLHPETADNNWTAAEHRKDNFSMLSPYPVANEKNNDDVALDAHWGAEVVLNYWKDKHNRNSYDDKGTKVVNYVHYGDAYDNAFWNGSAMTYGDGSYQGGTNPNGSFAPLTSMDVCAHEIGHGVCEFTADLVYQRESGAMNEGFSDIWAAAVEHYVLSEIDGSLNYDPWGIGEQIDERDGGTQPGNADTRALRWMDDPKAAGDPDSYGGENWIDPECGTPSLANDQCGVHTNSGVLNKWFYFLVEGSGKSFSPGYQKQSGDDQVSDAGNSYSVSGIGFEKAAQIAYLAETMLSPNAKFAEMRAASILVAQTVYGISSPEEEATTNAWYAVDIGDAYNSGEPNTLTFNEKNIQLLQEKNNLDGCDDFSIYNVQIQAVEVGASTNIQINTAGSTAILGKDFDLSTQSMTFSGSETKVLEVTVYNDAEIEGSETIRLSFIFDGQLMEQEFAISDDDFEPRKGSEPFTLLAEDFSGSSFSNGWTTVDFAGGANQWKMNGNLEAAGTAYITEGILDTPFYDSNSPSHTILRSPLLNAAGAKEVSVSFDWNAGGETDAVDPAVIFDYGEFVYSMDGATYQPVEKFVGGGVLGVETASGTFSATMSQLDGKAFFLGWRWFNDTNAGSQFSFSIDNVEVTAIPAGIETEANEGTTTNVFAASTAHLISDSDGGLIARLENASDDLGCVSISVVEAGTAAVNFSGIQSQRPSKVFNISTSNEDATYDLTLFFTAEEMSAFNSPAALIPLKVNSSNIDDANDRAVNFQLNGVLTEADTAEGYYAYTGTFTGSGSLSVVQDFTYCTSAPAPWQMTDVGTAAIAGELCYINDTFELTAEGRGMDANAEGFFYTYQEVSGDVDLVAKITGLERISSQTEAGVMIRSSLSTGANYAMTNFKADNSITGYTASFAYSRGKRTATLASVGATIPRYVRIQRSGKTINSYISDVNGEWQLLGSAKLDLGESFFIGLAASSGVSGATATAVFEEVQLSKQIEIATSQTKGNNPEFEESSNMSMSTYPNPASEVVNVSIAGEKIRSVQIYSISGQLMLSSRFSGKNDTEQMEISRLYNGVYIIKVLTSSGTTYDSRFAKE